MPGAFQATEPLCFHGKSGLWARPSVVPLCVRAGSRAPSCWACGRGGLWGGGVLLGGPASAPDLLLGCALVRCGADTQTLVGLVLQQVPLPLGSQSVVGRGSGCCGPEPCHCGFESPRGSIPGSSCLRGLTSQSFPEAFLLFPGQRLEKLSSTSFSSQPSPGLSWSQCLRS